MTFTTLTEPQVREAMQLFTKVGNLDLYPRLNTGVKISAAATAIASVLHWTVQELNEAIPSEEFKNNVTALIETFEIQHPEKVSEDFTLMKAMGEIAAAGMVGLPTTREEAEEMAGQGCTNPAHDHNQSAEPAARSVGFGTAHMVKDGTPDAKVDAEFDAMVKNFETETAPETKGKHRFTVDSDGSAEDGGK
jgi:hypothetical protein